VRNKYLSIVNQKEEGVEEEKRKEKRKMHFWKLGRLSNCMQSI
jgi:hypothetical protein